MADASERSGEEIRLRGESVSVAKLYMPVKIRIGQKTEEKDAKGPGCQSKEAHLSSAVLFSTAAGLPLWSSCKAR